jgi:hypothetical protein
MKNLKAGDIIKAGTIFYHRYNKLIFSKQDIIVDSFNSNPEITINKDNILNFRSYTKHFDSVTFNCSALKKLV